MQLHGAKAPPESCSASDCSDSSRDTANPQDTDLVAVGGAATGGSASGRSSPSTPHSRIAVDGLVPHLRCGLCREPVAGALVLNCGHLYCGACLVDHLTRAGGGGGGEACPACQMPLRAIPVRCIAIDHVVSALAPALEPTCRDALGRRRERGEPAPSVIAKMLWWLEAGAPAPGGASEPRAAAAAAAGGALLQQAAGRAACPPAFAPGSCITRSHSGTAVLASGALSRQHSAAAPVRAQSAPAPHDAIMSAAMKAAAAAAASAAALPALLFCAPVPAPVPAPLGMGAIDAFGGVAGTHAWGFGAMGGDVGLLGASLAPGLASGLPVGLADPMQQLPLMNALAYQAALQSLQAPGTSLQVAMQGAHGPVGAMSGAFPQLNLLGL